MVNYKKGKLIKSLEEFGMQEKVFISDFLFSKECWDNEMVSKIQRYIDIKIVYTAEEIKPNKKY